MYGRERADVALSPEALQVLTTYEWPENVRELRVCIERAIRTVASDVIGPELLSAALRDAPAEVTEPHRDLTPTPRASRATHGTHLATNSFHGSDPSSSPAPRAWEIHSDDEVSLDLYEKKCLLRAIDSTHGDKLKAAKLLKVGKSTLYRKLKKYGIQ
jgi:two-component system response regulator HydG